MNFLKGFLVLMAMATLSACAQGFVSSWKAPDAQPLQVGGSKVAAVVMMQNQASRYAAEDALAREITAHGAVGVPMYTIYPEGKPTDEAAARAALEKAGVAGVIVMRPVGVDKEIESTPATYSAPNVSRVLGWVLRCGMGQSLRHERRRNTHEYHRVG